MIGKFLRKELELQEANKSSRLSYDITDIWHGVAIEEANTNLTASIIRDGNSYSYIVGHPLKITGSDMQLMGIAKLEVIRSLSGSDIEITMNLFAQARALARDKLLKLVDPEKAAKLSYFVAHDTVGYGPLGILMEDKQNIEEIEVNAPKLPITVYVSKYGRCTTNLRFVDATAFRYNINRLISCSEKELSEDSPIIDAQVDNARIHAQIKPYALSGAAASIRLGGDKRIGIDLILKDRTADENTLAYLWLAMDSGLNIIISGAPASGKTTMLNTLLELIPMEIKTVTVEEDVNEIHFNDSFKNTIALYGEKYNITTKEQVINALRLRPDRIVIGEIRGSEAKDLFAGSSLGIPFITTMHSNDDPLGVIKRLIIRPMEVDVRSISALDLSVHMQQIDVNKRRINSIYEYKWLSRAEVLQGIEIGEDTVDTSRIMENGTLIKSSLQSSKVIASFGRRYGYSIKRSVQELDKRSRFLNKILSNPEFVSRSQLSVARYYESARVNFTQSV